MASPDQLLFEEDLRSAEYLIGVAKGAWAHAEPEKMLEGAMWPRVFFWLAAAPHGGAPDRFYVALDATGYRAAGLTGTFWNPETKARLDFAGFPKGTPNTRFAKVFRTDWGESSRAFYHPYDRIAAQGHAAWPREQPHLIWTSSYTIADYLDEFHALLNCGDYRGV